MDNKIELKSLRDLLGMNFFIPNYQRGYRWDEQVVDLLNDISEFIKKTHEDNRGYQFYCVQPLVIKQMSIDEKMENGLDNGIWYEVIDGQQRLTTFYILLASLESAFDTMGLPTERYNIKFQRESNDFNGTEYLKKIVSIASIDESHIDYYYFSKAFYSIKDWFKKTGANKGHFCNALLEKNMDGSNPQQDKARNIRFIWYEAIGENPIKVFTRLNVGKIPLTNAELIKALLLNSANFQTDDDEHLNLRQREIASEWDNIELTLQKDDFWHFLNNSPYSKPTRIDFIFDLICDINSMNIFANDNEDNHLSSESRIGNDEYRTFRYFYEYFDIHKSKEAVEECWDCVKKHFLTFNEWYDDVTLYHYIGYLINCGYDIKALLKIWDNSSTKEVFSSELKKLIVVEIFKCPHKDNQSPVDYQYKEDGSDKTKCKPILLFHNIQTIINQNIENAKTPSVGFYRFPFGIFKNENWDVEHINSNTTNPEEDENTRSEWLVNVYLSIEREDVKDKIIEYFQGKDEGVKTAIWKSIKDELPNPVEWTYEEKNRIWNYTLLDSSTNRSYGNSIFSAKRRIIIGKDKGERIEIPQIRIKRDKNSSLELYFSDGEKQSSTFVPICTKYVFLKYYTPSMGDVNYWDRETDAMKYKEDIQKCINQLYE